MKTARLLLIEDDAGIALVLKAWMEKHTDANLTIDHAPTFPLGLERAPGAAVIVLDLGLPPDWPAERTILQIPKLREFAPVVVLTGHSSGCLDDDAEFAASLISEHGADSVLFKDMVFNRTSDNVGWMFMSIQAAMGRRLFQQKIANEPK